MNEKIPVHHHILAACATLAFVGVAFISGVGAVFTLDAVTGGTQAAAVANALSVPTDVFPAPFSIPEGAIKAKAVMVIDLTDGRVLYQKNAAEPLPLASLTKLMTATVALAQMPTTTPIHVTASAVAIEGDWGFRPGDVVPLDDLLTMSLNVSSNDATQAIAESLGQQYLERINEYAQRIGLSSMRFNNPTGLDVNTNTAGAYGSAYDMARLTWFFFAQHPEHFLITTEPKADIQVDGKTLKGHATALPLQKLPGLLGAKTGYTLLAGGNLTAVFDAAIGHPVVAVVLGSTEDERFADMELLISTTRNQH